MPENKKEILTEALFPQLSNDTFTLCGKEIKLMPLKIKNQIEFGKLLAPLAGDIGSAVQFRDGGRITEHLLENMETIEKLALLISEDSDSGLTKEDLQESRHGVEELVELIVASARKNERIGKPVIDFFMKALSTLAPLINQIETLDFTAPTQPTSTESSPASAENTDGDTPTL